MQKITADSPEAKSADIVAENIAKLRGLFPEAFAEDGIDFEVLRQLLGDAVNEKEEKYSFTWPGKRQARQIALTPSLGTLRPAPEESVNWDTTQNLFIEGDNLEVLKLLQKSYSGKVKMIYIDPPYNTGNDFIYPDDYRDNIKNYFQITGQTSQEGVKMTSNPESAGRYHSNWLNMMYPRLCLAKNLLCDDGVIFISIDDNENENLLKLCGEIFGHSNHIGTIVWKARVKPINIGEAKYRPQCETEYILVYEKNSDGDKFFPLITGSVRSYPKEINGRKYRLATILKSNRGTNYRSTMTFEVDGYSPPEGQRWQAGESEIRSLLDSGYIEFQDETPFRRYFEEEEGAEHDPFYCFMENEWSSTSEHGKQELNRLVGEFHGFDTVKPTSLLRTLIMSCTRQNDIILDFFSGSATTAHAVMIRNAENYENRRVILVQIPEPCDEQCKIDGVPITNICEIGKERIRRVGTKIRADNSGEDSRENLDLGFRVFKLDNSNIRPWNPDANDVAGSLLAYTDNLLPDRTEQDLLYEVLLKFGLDLTSPMQEKIFAGHTVYSIGQGVLFACLSKAIAAADVEPIGLGIAAWRKEANPVGEGTVIFRDSAFAGDVAKANMTAILQQYGIDSVRSL
jgi:adenine-specific DNA-methyltransferase